MNITTTLKLLLLLSNKISEFCIADFAAAVDPFIVLEVPKGRVLEDSKGFRYSLVSRLKNGNHSWKCSRKAKGCKAYVITQHRSIIRRVHSHIHDP